MFQKKSEMLSKYNFSVVYQQADRGSDKKKISVSYGILDTTANSLAYTTNLCAFRSD